MGQERSKPRVAKAYGAQKVCQPLGACVCVLRACPTITRPRSGRSRGAWYRPCWGRTPCWALKLLQFQNYSHACVPCACVCRVHAAHRSTSPASRRGVVACGLGHRTVILAAHGHTHAHAGAPPAHWKKRTQVHHQHTGQSVTHPPSNAVCCSSFFIFHAMHRFVCLVHTSPVQRGPVPPQQTRARRKQAQLARRKQPTPPGKGACHWHKARSIHMLVFSNKKGRKCALAHAARTVRGDIDQRKVES